MTKHYNYKSIIFLAIAIVFLGFSLINLYEWFTDNQKTKIIETHINITPKEEHPNNDNLILINPPENLSDPYWLYQDTPFLNIDFTPLIAENRNTQAWIQVNGTKIDYPVVQTTDNEYYLTHSFDNTFNKAGWIFADFRNNFINLNNNTIIYGHRRLNDSMFGSLKYVLTDEWFNNQNNHLVKISTPTNNTIWQIFSVYAIPAESYYLTAFFPNNLEYQNFLQAITKHSKYDFGTTINYQDKILTLSSCQDDLGNRIVVHAKLIKKETR